MEEDLGVVETDEILLPPPESSVSSPKGILLNGSSEAEEGNRGEALKRSPPGHVLFPIRKQVTWFLAEEEGGPELETQSASKEDEDESAPNLGRCCRCFCCGGQSEAVEMEFDVEAQMEKKNEEAAPEMGE